jgi:hypothetical protein
MTKHYTQVDLDLYPLHCPVCKCRASVRAFERDDVFTQAEAQRAHLLGRLAWERAHPEKFVYTACRRCMTDELARPIRLKKGQIATDRLVVCQRCCTAHPYVVPTAVPSSVYIAMGPNRVARCPSCGTGIEKIGGCNAMACVCGASFQSDLHVLASPVSDEESALSTRVERGVDAVVEVCVTSSRHV